MNQILFLNIDDDLLANINIENQDFSRQCEITNE
jgi:hypothetical protein